jgi:hypothetical protein
MKRQVKIAINNNEQLNIILVKRSIKIEPQKQALGKCHKDIHINNSPNFPCFPTYFQFPNAKKTTIFGSHCSWTYFLTPTIASIEGITCVMTILLSCIPKQNYFCKSHEVAVNHCFLQPTFSSTGSLLV